MRTNLQFCGQDICTVVITSCNENAILAMGFQGNLSMAQTYYTAAKPYLALEHAEVIKKYLHIK